MKLHFRKSDFFQYIISPFFCELKIHFKLIQFIYEALLF